MLDLVQIRKEYPGTVALDGVSISFERGKVHALLGKNGAGKSTVVKILSGAVQPTSGKVLLNGKEITLASPQAAFSHGISTVYQELSILPEMTVGENIMIGRLPKKEGFGKIMVDWPKLYQRADDVLKDMQVELDVRKKASELGVAQQQIVEIAKAISFSPSVLLLDEPTSALAYHEVERLFELIRMLARKGMSIIYITHRLHEVQQIADNISVLRDGKYIGSMKAEDATPAKIVDMMFGEIPVKTKPSRREQTGPALLEVRNLRAGTKLKDISFSLFKGEVLGIAGMLGSGRTELLRALYGADRPDEGEVIVDGSPHGLLTPIEARAMGIAFLSEDRKNEGLVQSLSTRINVCLASYNLISKRGLVTKKRESDVVKRFVRELNIKIADEEQPVSSLSGGNQQKVVIAKWLNIPLRVLLLDEPTRGIDIQTKQQIFQIITELSDRGISSVFVSTELEELLEVCHIILIMKNGRIVSEVRPQDLTANELFVLCMEK